MGHEDFMRQAIALAKVNIQNGVQKSSTMAKQKLKVS